jgi:hypothetical protein
MKSTCPQTSAQRMTKRKKQCIEPGSCIDTELYDVITHKLDKSILSVKLPKSMHRVEEREKDKNDVKKPPLPIVHCFDRYGKILIIIYLHLNIYVYYTHENAFNL